MEFTSPDTVVHALNELLNRVSSGSADSSTVPNLLLSLSIPNSEILVLNKKICVQDTIYKHCIDRSVILQYWIKLISNLHSNALQSELLSVLVYTLRAAYALFFADPTESRNAKNFLEEYAKVVRSLQFDGQTDASEAFYSTVLTTLFTGSSKLRSSFELHLQWYLKMVYFLLPKCTIQPQVLFNRHQLSLFPLLQSHFSKYQSFHSMNLPMKKAYLGIVKAIFHLLELGIKKFDKESSAFKDPLLGFLSKLKRYSSFLTNYQLIFLLFDRF